MPFPDQLQTPPPAIVPDPFLFPTKFVVGDQLTYRVENTQPHSSADGWSFVLVLRLENPAASTAAISINSAIDSGDFLISATPTTTADWTAGRYQVQLLAVNAGESKRETVMETFLQVNANLATVTGTKDVRSHARRTLDLIEALIEGRATNDIIDSTIDNTRFTRMTFTELRQVRKEYRLEVRAEEAKARARAGLGTGRMVLTRFVNP